MVRFSTRGRFPKDNRQFSSDCPIRKAGLPEKNGMAKCRRKSAMRGYESGKEQEGKEKEEGMENRERAKNKDYRVRVTKRIVREEFTKLLLQKPIQSITVRELCERTGINRSTFYNHYRDVYELLEQIENEMLAELGARLKEVAQENDLMSMRLFEGIFRFLTQNQDICVIMLGENGDKRFVYRMLEMGREYCVKNYSAAFPRASKEEIEDFYAFVSNGCIGLMTRWIRTGMKKSPDELARTAKAIMSEALGVFRGR